MNTGHGSSSPPPHDVRMRGFASRTKVRSALKWVDDHAVRQAGESVPLAEAAGRVLSASVCSRVDVPGFDRAMMDGYALRAGETHGASEYNRLAFTAAGESLPGRPCPVTVAGTQAVKIMTGAPMPAGADAVIPIERVSEEGRKVWIHGDVAPGKHVARVGEDVKQGVEVLTAGRRLRPQDVGVISSIGIDHVDVVRRPRVRIVVTGNEILPAGTPPRDFAVSDANGPMLHALACRDGAVVEFPGIIPDHPEAIREALLAEAEIVLVSGGSSVGQEDFAPSLVRELGELPIHGVAMRPSSPTGMGRVEGRLVFLLPGNPVSCLCGYDFFAGRAIRLLGGRPTAWPYAPRRNALARKLVSVVGRVDYARVRLDADGLLQPIAISGAGVLTSTTRADGFVVIPEDSEGYPEHREVHWYAYDVSDDAEVPSVD